MKERKVLIKNLKIELNEMQNEIEKISVALNRKNETNVILWVIPIKTYIWDSITNNKIELLSDKEWYKELLYIYHTVHEYNKWHMLRTQSAINEQKYFLTEPSVKQISEELNDKIKAVLPKLK